MKKIITVILLSVAMSLRAYPLQQSIAELLPDDYEILEQAVAAIDNKDFDAADEKLSQLLSRYPDSHVIRYEMALLDIRRQRYDDALKLCAGLIGNGASTPRDYQLYGNLLDIMNRPEDARKVYKAGLRVFPTSGELYLESGVMDLNDEDYDSALAKFNKGIEVAPGYASNYYRVALLYANTDHPVWALIYADTEILLNWHDSGRHKVMAGLLSEIYAEDVRI